MASSPRDLADRMAGRASRRRKPDDGFLRETFTLPREKARATARDFRPLTVLDTEHRLDVDHGAASSDEPGAFG